MLGDAKNAVRYASGYDFQAFQELPETDGNTYRALTNAVTELGEAAKKLPKDLTDRHTEIDWSGICGIRDVVARRYFQVNVLRLWPVVTHEIPNMIHVLQSELSDLPNPEEPGGFHPQAIPVGRRPHVSQPSVLTAVPNATGSMFCRLQTWNR